MQIVRINGQLGVFSWTNGFCFSSKNQENDYRKEASGNKNDACAVVARLMREDRWDEAEEVLDRYV